MKDIFNFKSCKGACDKFESCDFIYKGKDINGKCYEIRRKDGRDS